MAKSWRSIVASSLDWEQAHASFDSAVKNLDPELRGKRPDGFPHSAWELVEHVRLAQIDLLAFMQNSKYKAPKWPDDYWPPTPEPPDEAAWTKSSRAIRRDCRALQRFTETTRKDLTAKIPRGDGQTFLRTILVTMDHTSYHVGQIVAVRILLGAWPR